MGIVLRLIVRQAGSLACRDEGRRSAVETEAHDD
jgi:hypothetical protein